MHSEHRKSTRLNPLPLVDHLAHRQLSTSASSRPLYRQWWPLLGACYARTCVCVCVYIGKLRNRKQAFFCLPVLDPDQTLCTVVHGQRCALPEHRDLNLVTTGPQYGALPAEGFDLCSPFCISA